MTDRRRSIPTRQAYRPGPPEPEGRHIGPIAITPTGILLVIAFVGSVLYLLYAITVRDASQIPLLASGAAVLGIVFVATAATGLVATWRSSLRGRDGRALAHAVIGGVACLAAAACFAVAIILALVGGS
jgi:drug/metabolite transporter (DMT)-like permease